MQDEKRIDLDELMEQDSGDPSCESEYEPFSLRYDPLPERRGRPVDKESKRFNEALWRIIKGKYDIGGIAHELAVITGLSIETIRGRVNDMEYAPDQLEPGVGLDSSDLKYMSRYKKLDDPEVKEFLQRINGGRRKHPDREDARVKRQRITKADGTSKLISISMGISKN